MVDLPIYKADFTRASKATFINKQGVLVEADIDEPRFEKEGILIEGGSTNLVNVSGAEGYEKRISLSSTNNELIDDPIGVTVAKYLLDVEVNSDVSIKTSNIVGTNDIQYTASVFIKVSEYVRWRLRFAADNIWKKSLFFLSDAHSCLPESDEVETSSNIYDLGDGWFRVSGFFTPDIDGEINFGVYLDGRGISLNTNLYTFGFQVEELPFASSYIPTDGAAVTRSPDKIEIPSVKTIVTDNTVYAEVSYNDFKADWAKIINNVMPSYRWESGSVSTKLSAYRGYIRDDGSSYHCGVQLTGDYSIENINKFTVVAEGEKFISYKNGLLQQAISYNLPELYDSCLQIGSSGTAFFHIRDLKIWYYALSPEQIYNL